MLFDFEAFMSRGCWAILVVAPCLFSGCTSLPEYIRNGFKVGPNYATPPASVADDWIDKRKDGEELTQWWTVFKDPVLNDLVCTAYQIGRAHVCTPVTFR